MKDLDILEELEELLYMKLESTDLDNIIYESNGYALDEKNNIIGLNIFQSEIADISILEDLPHLTHLCLWENQISDISVIKNLIHLTHLYLGENHISEISVLKGLKKLKVLNLSMNQISEISFLKDMTRLKTLNLAGNRIHDISPLKALKHLKVLELAGNRISDITVLKYLPGLTEIDLTDNKISVLPVEILDQDIDIKWEFEPAGGGGIYLEGNPLEKPPLEIVKRGKKAINAYFKSLESEKRALNEVKMLLVGDGGVGKTSLVKQLLEKSFNKNEPPTHGINVDYWEIKPGNETVRVHLWDFGGQEIMHATHQFFLSKRSLYVLVLDGRREEKAEYWLKEIESLGGASPTLVVLNKMDDNPGFEINRKFLLDKYPNIKGFHRISCATKQGIKDFSINLTGELANVELIHTTWGQNWFNIKNQLENMKDNYMSYEKYEEMCDKVGIHDEESQNTLAEFLNDLGIVLHFKDPALKETNVINPRWATGAVYKIINSKELAENKGILSKNSLKMILDKHEYPIRKHDFIIELMRKFELCFFLDKNTILVPDLLDVAEPEFEFNYETALKFVIQYEFLPKSIIHRFIVRMRKDIKNDLRWRTGVVLEDKVFDSAAVVKVDENDKKIAIRVDGSQRRAYFSIIRKILRDICADFENLKYTEWVPLPDDNKYLVEYDNLIGLERLKEEFITIGKTGKKYRVSELLDGLEDKNYRNLTRVPVDTDKNYEWEIFISYASKDYSIVEKIVSDLKIRGIRYWLDREQINPGDSFPEKIAEGLQKSRCVLTCFSRNQLQSGWCRVEYTAVLNEVISGRTGQKVIPLILDDLKQEEIPILLRFYGSERLSDTRGYQKLLQTFANL